MNNKKIIAGLYILVIVGLLVCGFIQLLLPQSNGFIEDKPGGEISGYQLVLTANWSGFGVAGQDLGHGSETKTYDIVEGDVFYEPVMGGIWTQATVATPDYESSSSPLSWSSTILGINEINADNVSVLLYDYTYNRSSRKYENKIKNVGFNESFSLNSHTRIDDGINYDYEIKFVKKYK